MERDSRPQHRYYPRAPITEAVIDFQFAEMVDARVCDRAKNRLKQIYPNTTDWIEYHVEVNPQTKASEFHERVRGFRLSDLDETCVVIVANTRFAVSRLAPYAGWDEFRERLVRDWKTFKSVAGYKKIARIGVRYINRIDIPLAGKPIELSDYIRFYLEVPQPPFPPIDQQFSQAVFSVAGRKIVLNTGTVPSPLIGYGSVALDIDIACDTNVPQTDDEILSYLETVRDQKNMLFEACITDRARALFEQ
jgi:uncharacterized protein (TIGR04255 family)